MVWSSSEIVEATNASVFVSKTVVQSRKDQSEVFVHIQA